MKVKELIHALLIMDENKDVCFYSDEIDGGFVVKHVSKKENSNIIQLKGDEYIYMEEYKWVI